VSETRRTLGVIGTLVWDRIVSVDSPPVERWGGIGYALAAAVVALPPGWNLRPIVRVGADLASEARTLVGGLPRTDASGLAEVPEVNNRVELRYSDHANRVECLAGGVTGWPTDELIRATAGCDALLLNFISGFEASIETCEALRAAFRGPIYADLHSLCLGMEADGTRVPRSLDDWRRWVACFDFVQVNEDEFNLLGAGAGRAVSIESVVTEGPEVVAITKGAAGATIAVRDGARVDVRDVTLGSPQRGDPTGCGDVWGGTMFSRLLAGDEPAAAARSANEMAAASTRHRGVEGLAERLAEHWAGAGAGGVRGSSGSNSEGES
jgi:sugar/nucleoside kinase (ribokinase family)